MKIKELMKSPPNETYVKNSSPLVTALFVIAGILWYFIPYGSIIALVLALVVLMGQYLLLTQTNRHFGEMYTAKAQFNKTRNIDYLRFIQAQGEQMLKDNKVLSNKAKLEIAELLMFVQKQLSEVRNEK